MTSLSATLAKGHLISAVNQISTKYQLSPADTAGILSGLLLQVQEQVALELAAKTADTAEKLKEYEDNKKGAE